MAFYTKILLVDDDKDDQVFFLDALTEINPAIACGIANNGLEAMDHLKSIPPPPSIIFLDLNMPYMNGFECLSAIKLDQKYKDIPVVIITTSNSALDREKSIKMGANTFMTKPSDFFKLKENIRKVLENNLS
jgi:CheY-like chemotaxis protein